jgi:hypothetical protein
MGLDRKLDPLEIVGEGFAIIPFAFVINGTSDPDGIIGKTILTAVRSEAGEFLCTLVASTTPYVCYYGEAGVSVTADDTDVTGLVDWSTVASAGTFVVRTMTGAVQTDPTDNLLVGGFLLVKKTDRT